MEKPIVIKENQLFEFNGHTFKFTITEYGNPVLNMIPNEAPEILHLTIKEDFYSEEGEIFSEVIEPSNTIKIPNAETHTYKMEYKPRISKRHK